MSRREFQSQFADGNTEGTSWIRRPDAISASYLQALSPGPRALNDPTEGLLVKGWYVRADNLEGKVYIAGAKADIRLGWEEEQLLFEYTGADIAELDFAFDQNGAPMVVMERTDGHLWIRYYKPSVAGFVLEDFGAGLCPRVILDDPIKVGTSDLLVFYKAGGTLQYREQNDLYVTPTDTGVPLTTSQFLEGTVRDGSLRVHVIISTRTAGTGTWALTRETSQLYPYHTPPDSLGVGVEALGGAVDVMIMLGDGGSDELEIGAVPLSGDVIVASMPIGLVESTEISASVESVEIVVVHIVIETPPESLDIGATPISGAIAIVLIEYEAGVESLDIGATAISGTVTVP